MGTTDRDYADKGWRSDEELLPLPASPFDVMCAILAAVGIALLVWVALGLR